MSRQGWVYEMSRKAKRKVKPLTITSKKLFKRSNGAAWPMP